MSESNMSSDLGPKKNERVSSRKLAIEIRARKKHYRELLRKRKQALLRSLKNPPVLVPKRRRIKNIRKGTVSNLRLPSTLSLLDNYDVTSKFFSDLRRSFLEEKNEIILIHMEDVDILGPESALVLIAELFRLMKHSQRTKLYCYGKCRGVEAEDILKGVGFYDYFTKEFDRSKKRGSSARVSRTYIRHRKGFRTSGQIASDLVEEFCKKVPMTDSKKSQLRVSLGECMENVGEHAYQKIDKIERNWIEKIWWIMGYTDEKEAYFAFLDQGVGIPKSLRAGKISKSLISQLDDENIVLRAFEGPLSRTGEAHRGRGLPILRKYAEESSSGFLAVQTGNVRCDFSSDGKISTKNTSIPFKGTLLVWNIKNTPDNG